MAIAIQPYGGALLESGRTRSTFNRMAAAEERSADEARLAQRAVAGDGDAFATLYTRYEKRAYNLCLRILGSEDDAADATQEAFVNVLKRLPKLEGRELAFGSYLFTSARHACYDLIERRKRAEPSDDIAEGAVPVGGGVGGGGIGFDPGDPHDDPERNVLLAARQDEIRDANAKLPARQREVLVLRELEDLSYDEIAELMEMNRNSVAQLISRARINLRDALRGTALASVATSSADCQRSLAMLAARQDGQADVGDAWLEEHMRSCETCPLAREAMEEAGISYRAWLPVAAGPLMFRETVAEAAETVGADWSDVIARHEARTSAPRGLRARFRSAAGGGVSGAAQPGSARASLSRHRKRDLALVGALALVLLLVGFAASLGDGTNVEEAVPVADEQQPAETAEEPPPEPGDEQPKKKEKPAKQDGGPQGAPAGAPDEPQTNDEPEPAAGEAPSAPTGDGGGTRRRSRDDTTRRRGGGGGERLDGEDPPVVTDPPPEPPPQDPPAPEPPVIVDPPPEEPCRTPSECPPEPPPCIPGQTCPRVPGTPPSGPPTRP
jgi:RNA polymerase sigma factor (sigma-70 family)